MIVNFNSYSYHYKRYPEGILQCEGRYFLCLIAFIAVYCNMYMSSHVITHHGLPVVVFVWCCTSTTALQTTTKDYTSYNRTKVISYI
jgi:hypothetical protein